MVHFQSCTSLFDIRLCIRFYNKNSAVKATKRRDSNPRSAAVKNSIENTLVSWKVFWRAQQLMRACPEKAVQPRVLTISSVQSTRTCIFTLVEYSQAFFRNCLKNLNIKIVANTSLPNQTIMELCMFQFYLLPSPPGQPPGQVQPFGPGGGELFETVLSRG